MTDAFVPRFLVAVRCVLGGQVFMTGKMRAARVGYLQRDMSGKMPGESVSVKIFRHGKRKELKVELGAVHLAHRSRLVAPEFALG